MTRSSKVQRSRPEYVREATERPLRVRIATITGEQIHALAFGVVEDGAVDEEGVVVEQRVVQRGVLQTGRPFLVALEHGISPNTLRTWLAQGKTDADDYEQACEAGDEPPRTIYAQIYDAVQVGFARWILDRLDEMQKLATEGDRAAIAYLLESVRADMPSVADIAGVSASPLGRGVEQVRAKLDRILERHRDDRPALRKAENDDSV